MNTKILAPTLDKQPEIFIIHRMACLLLLFTSLYLFPVFTLLYICCGLYDVARNDKLSLSFVDRYFFGNGVLTWVFSPFNVLMDISTLPFINKKIYQLDDLPKACQGEIQQILDVANNGELIKSLSVKAEKIKRSMIFFKWYDNNVDNFFNVPEFHQEFKYIKTIGVSVFNKREWTAEHFGPLRATLRVLYNINDIKDPSAYLEVGKTQNHWCENKLFIFDDTLSHQSFNDTDEVRYCLFVDILRPSLSTWLFNQYVSLIAFLVQRMNHIFYGSWTPLK